jgi:hypothetical protein
MSITFTVDGEADDDAILAALTQLTEGTEYIGSETVDGTDKWGIIIESIETELIDGLT